MKRVAVIGGGLGGMTAAGALAKAGHRVTLFERSDVLGGKARALSVDGVQLDTGPTLLTLPHVVRETFRRLGADALLPSFTRLELQCEYRYPDGARFTAFDDLDKTAASAAAIHSSDGPGVRSFYEQAAQIHRATGAPYLDAPFEGTIEFMRRVAASGASPMTFNTLLSSLHGLGAKHFTSQHLRQFVGRFATYAGASPWDASAAFALIPHIEREFGVHHVTGGMGALVAALEVAVVRLGVQVVRGSTARWEARGQGFVAGVTGGEEAFDTVVVNADPLGTIGRGREPLALSGYVLLLEADRRLPLPHHVVSFSADYPREFKELFSGRIANEPTVYICHPAATDETMAPEGKSGLFVMLNAPPLPAGTSREAWQPHLDTMRRQCLAAVEALPEARGVRLRVLGERSAFELEAIGAPGGSIYGFLPHGVWGSFRRPRMRGARPGLFYVGGGTHPGGGVPLVMLSGRFAASMADDFLRGVT